MSPSFTSRLSSSPSKPAQNKTPEMIPYRENGVVKYAPAPQISSLAFSGGGGGDGDGYSSDYDAPLLQHQVVDTASTFPSDHDAEATLPDALQRFTATGRPITSAVTQSYRRPYQGDSYYTAPNLLPARFTDESIIPAIILSKQIVSKSSSAAAATAAADVTDSSTPVVESSSRKSPPSSSSLLSKFRRHSSSSSPSSSSTSSTFSKDTKSSSKIRVVYMPRGEYLKYFARDDAAAYRGTEPERLWSEEELDAHFGQYQKRPQRADYKNGNGNSGSKKNKDGIRSSVAGFFGGGGSDVQTVA